MGKFAHAILQRFIAHRGFARAPTIGTIGDKAAHQATGEAKPSLLGIPKCRPGKRWSHYSDSRSLNVDSREWRVMPVPRCKSPIDTDLDDEKLCCQAAWGLVPTP